MDSRDIRALEGYLQKLSGGDFSAAAPQVQSPQLQGLARKFTGFVQEQQRRYIDLLMEINISVVDESKSSEALNKIAMEYEQILQTVNELMHDGRCPMVNRIGLAAADRWEGPDIPRPVHPAGSGRR